MHWHYTSQDYTEFKRPDLANNLQELKKGKESKHPVSNQILPATDFIVFDAPLGRLHQETGQYIDTMVHIKVSLDVSLCRRILRDAKNYSKDEMLEEIKYYLEHSRPLFFDDKLIETADFVLDGMLNLEEELKAAISYITTP